jgi:uncharacterized membrane protein HdeD (DUF308 family)
MTEATTAAPSQQRSVPKTMGINILTGLIFILAGTAAIVLPLASTWAVTIVVGASLIVSGVAQIVHAFSRSWGSFFLHCLLGVLYLLSGLSFWLMPVTAAILLTVVLAVMLIVQGFGEMWLAFRSRGTRRWGWLFAAGIVAVVAGVWVLLRMPSYGILLPGVLLGISLVVEGWAFLLMRRA